MNRFLTLDAGNSTGWCMFQNDAPYLWGTSEHRDLIEVLRGLASLHFPKAVIAERAVVRGVGYTSLINGEVMGIIQNFFPDVKWILPAAWKPLVAHQPKDLKKYTKETKPTRHELDAICIGLYVVTFKPSLLETPVA